MAGSVKKAKVVAEAAPVKREVLTSGRMDVKQKEGLSGNRKKRKVPR